MATFNTTPRLSLVGPSDDDPKQRLVDYAKGQRERGEQMVAASSTLKSLRRINQQLVAQTQPIVSQLRDLRADATKPLDGQMMTPNAREIRRRELVEQLSKASTAVTDHARGWERSLLSDFNATRLREWGDLTPTPEQSAKVSVTLTQIMNPRLRPDTLTQLCWDAVLNFDTATALAIRPSVEAYADHPQYQAYGDAMARANDGVDPLTEVLRAIDLMRTTDANHAARIVRQILPRVHDNIDTMAATIAAEPYGWLDRGDFSGSLNHQRRPDGRLVLTPELDPLSGDPPTRVIDDPEWYEFDQPPFPVIH